MKVGLWLGVLVVTVARAAPVSSCTANMSGVGITCNVFESDVSGNPSEMSNIFSLGTSAVAGYVVLLEASGADQTNVANWSDVLHFIDDGGGFASTAQLLSDGCNCFPSFATVNAAGGAFIVETQTGTGDDFTDSTQYSPSGTDVYNIFSGAPVNETGDVPEPASVALLGGGLVASMVVERLGRHCAFREARGESETARSQVDTR
ncbi:MAG TPA: PEP-CTERM sorting domain-containing protein [Bryobacteraceae bacterium]|nr:PEP-CTERM sorting domain-containing protein [Bryobacteraceae bacterium]